MACSASAAALLSIFLFFFFFSSFVSGGRHDCPPSSCGNITNIKNPFRLKDDPPKCGDPNYELTCDDLNRTILTLLNNSYYVTNITYLYDDLYMEVDFMIEVVNVGMVNDGSCHLPLPSLTLSEMNSNSYYVLTSTYSWVTLVNCSKEVKNNSKYRPVPCLSHNNSFIYFINDTYESYVVRNLMCSCRSLAIFPVNYEFSSQLPTDIIKFLAQGFTLSRNDSMPNTFRDCLWTSIR
ncbi:hypothetical protein IHE45_05G137100 [Dioscorea alata]|uniref:Uncharacterized protein n=1 Tax=Dioscorea alata TaxID=55571 RepID=A0ACB7W4S8_DIOAL|nr:hypothetical protein IHE45_05G137100 [Dioscorea alata]